METNFEFESCDVLIAVEAVVSEVDGLLVVLCRVDCETNKVGNEVKVELTESSLACVGDEVVCKMLRVVDGEVVCKVLGVDNRVEDAELPGKLTDGSEVVGCLVVRTSAGNPEILNFQAADDCRLTEVSLV